MHIVLRHVLYHRCGVLVLGLALSTNGEPEGRGAIVRVGGTDGHTLVVAGVVDHA